MIRKTLTGMLLALQSLHSNSQTVIPLDGNSWTLENASKNISVPATVPGSVHLDLLAAKVIGDPYYGLNEVNLRWVIGDVWKYSRPISMKADPNLSTYLEFDGIDTFASIKFCGKTIGSINNQFRQYTFDVSSLVQRCSNFSHIEVGFTSATTAADKSALNASCPLCVGINYEFDNMQFIRKQQCNFGWDWGPAFSPAGVWKSARIVQVPKNSIQIQNSMVDIYCQGQLNNLPPDQRQPWVMNVSIDFLGHLSWSNSMALKLTDSKNETIVERTLRNVNIGGNATTRRMTADILVTEDVDLWWPVGYGNQQLYNLDIQIQDGKNNTFGTAKKKIGFRTVVLDQREIPAIKSLEINGRNIYCKGSNLIPPDSFWTRVTKERMKDLLESVIDSNQNMLRVWGGGSYLPDFVYDMADEMDLLIWTDFHLVEFSDALSPIDPVFLANVRAEAEYQVRRVNHHPSMAVWVRNNEVELGIQLYEKLFVDLLLHAVFDNTRSLSYSPSSITNGYLSLNFSSPAPIVERYFNVAPGTISGNTDYYNYDTTQAFNNSAYPIGRFATEFGFHSMPSVQTWLQVAPESDLHFNSSTILTHVHHYVTSTDTLLTVDYSNQTASALGGMGQMSIAAEQYYPVPPNDSHSIPNFSSWIYTTQVFQADFMRNQISFYRIGSGRPERNLGALYWQLNDVWQAPTWAGLEYDGRWKLLHYIVKDVFRPVIIAPYFNYSTADLRGIRCIRSLEYCQWECESHLLQPFNAVAKFEVEVQSTPPHLTEPVTYTHETWFHAVPLKDQAMIDPKPKMAYDDIKGKFAVSAESGIAAWVWLDHPSGAVGNFEDNGFWLAPGQSREVGFKVKGDETNGEWVKSVTVRSLWDNKM
ncbi:glycoside hydrolase family 2 protein [Cadophora sp. DSE1049]|nr:glycoside hydrolase family 2 protein [Cadophora sp. DSE1049]